MPASIEVAHEQEFHDNAEAQADEWRQDQGQPEATGDLSDREAGEGAQHEKRAVGQVDHVHQPEDQR
jgi:hypothetical protein